MRPVRLVLEGFSAFRDRVEVDFEDAELFALVGPTGAGKSSIIDGITFALYGVVARYDDDRLVAPVVHQRSVSARVDLIFEVGGEQYRVFREVTRKGSRGTTKEARLERVDRGDAEARLERVDRSDAEARLERVDRGDAEARLERVDRSDAVLAGDAKGVTAAVERLLGLTFAQFSTCVVLPQGEFARFLHDTPAHRRDLLVRLLELGLYDSIGQLARARAKQAGAQVELLDRQLVELRESVPDEAELDARVTRLAALLDEVELARPEFERLAREADEALARAAELDRRGALLDAARVPEDLDSLVTAQQTAELELEHAVSARESCEVCLAEVESRQCELPDRPMLQAARSDHEAHHALAGRVADGEAKTASVESEASRAGEAAAAASGHLASCRDSLVASEREHTAHALASGLAIGDPCPVCHRPLGELPAHDLTDLEGLRDAVARAERDAEEADRAQREATSRVAEFQARLDGLREQLAEIDARLSGAPTAPEVEAALSRWVECDEAIERARGALRAARDQEHGAEKRRKQVEVMTQSAWGSFDDVRDRLAALEPPPVDRADLASAWGTLEAWVVERRAQVADDLGQARDVATEVERQQAERVGRLDDACRQAGVEPAGRPHRDVVVDALATARREQDRAVEQRRQLGERSTQRDELDAARQVADLLGRLLRSDGFLAWLLDEAMAALVAGATIRLRQLSRQQYSLALDEKGGFLVIDHSNADEARLARTLSGGETFLASLSLALALADQVSGLAAAGAPRLESIVLDEGFGTLDPETLDVVVGAIEELQADGRMVGLVSHVAEVAERVPVRFEVRREATTSVVTRVEA